MEDFQVYFAYEDDVEDRGNKYQAFPLPHIPRVGDLVTFGAWDQRTALYHKVLAVIWDIDGVKIADPEEAFQGVYVILEKHPKFYAKPRR